MYTYKLNVAKIIALIMNGVILFQDVTVTLIPIAIQVIQVFMKKFPSLQNIRYARNADASQWVVYFVFRRRRGL